MRCRYSIVTLACLQAAGWAAAPAWADSGVVGPGLVGNAQNPVARLGAGQTDPAGLSPYRQPSSRSPAGTLYELPPLPGPSQRWAGDWEVSAFGELGVYSAGASERNALFSQYRDIDQGLTLGRLDAQAYQASTARFVELRGGGVSRNDAYFGLQFGRYSDYRVSLSFDQTPHVSSTTARPIWQGLGSDRLTLTPAAGVAAGGASANNAANAAALRQLIAQTGDVQLAVQRNTGSARLEMQLAPGWSLSSSYALERRRGARAWGGNQGNGETVESIDYRTHDLRAGLQFADATTQFNLSGWASWFRNGIDTLTWDNPFRHPVGALAIERGRADLAPDNAQYQLKAELAQALPAWWRGRLTATVEAGTLRQNDRLIPPTVTSGQGAPFGSGFDGNFDRWNTAEALGQERAHARIDTRLVDVGLTLAPLDRLNLRATLRHQDTRNHTRYTAFNPLTGQYGYIIQDTNASRIYGGNNNVHYRSIPFEGAQDVVRLGAELALRRRAALTAELERETLHREHRERNRTWEDRVRLGYTDRGFESVTLRLSAEQARRGGSPYNSTPYREFYTESLPGYQVTRNNLLDRLYNLDDLRKFDLADRQQQIFKARVGVLPRDDLDIGITLQARSNRYADQPAAFGRTGTQSQQLINLDLGYLPSTRTTVHAHLTQQRSRMQQAGVGDLGGPVEAGCFVLPPSCNSAFAAPRSIYPAGLAWSAQSRERSSTVGLGLRHDFGRPQLELQATRVKSRSPLSYTYATPEALQSPSQVAAAADGFADMRHELRSLEAGLRLPLNRHAALRLNLRHESVRVSDWHYTGFDQGLIVGNRVYLDAGPANYRINVIGVFLQLML